MKRMRRKQSNRESARRSRLRKQAECEQLSRQVKDLASGGWANVGAGAVQERGNQLLPLAAPPSLSLSAHSFRSLCLRSPTSSPCPAPPRPAPCLRRELPPQGGEDAAAGADRDPERQALHERLPRAARDGRGERAWRRGCAPLLRTVSMHPCCFRRASLVHACLAPVGATC